MVSSCVFFKHRSRKENLARAIEHESGGNASAAYECYQKAVDISPAIAYELIQVTESLYLKTNYKLLNSYKEQHLFICFSSEGIETRKYFIRCGSI